MGREAESCCRSKRGVLAFLGAGDDAMACGDEEASARVRVWRRRRRRGEWCEEGTRGVLESGRAEVSGRVAILLRGASLPSLSRWCSRSNEDTVYRLLHCHVDDTTRVRIEPVQSVAAALDLYRSFVLSGS